MIAADTDFKSASERRATALAIAKRKRNHDRWLGVGIAVALVVFTIVLAGNVYKPYPVWVYAIVLAFLVVLQEWSSARFRYQLARARAENEYLVAWNDMDHRTTTKRAERLRRDLDYTEQLLAETNGVSVVENRKEVARLIERDTALDEMEDVLRNL